MATAQLSGMRAVYLAAAELAKLNLVASVTSRGAAGADILAATSNCNKVFSIQVKSSQQKLHFRLGPNAKKLTAKSHLYILVSFSKRKDEESVTFYVVPSSVIAKRSRATKIGTYSIKAEDIREFRNRWIRFAI